MAHSYFSKSHECFSLDGNIATVSITPYAVDQLGEITYVQLPAVGKTLKQGESFGEIESVKTVSELYAPISGTVTAVNGDLDAQPELVNADTYTQGWMLKIELSQPDEVAALMDESAYTAYIEALA